MRIKVQAVRKRPDPRGRPAAAGRPSPVRAVLDALYDTVLVTDSGGRILEANRRAERHLGYPRESLAGRPLSRILDGFTPELISSIRRRLDEGAHSVLEAYCRPRGREPFLAELGVGRLLDGAGDRRMLFTLRNIEPRKKTREMLRAAHLALEHSASGMAMADREGRILRGNPAFLAIWGFGSAGEAEGGNVRDLWEPGGAPEQALLKPLAGESWIGELEARTRKGRGIRVQVAAAPIRDGEDRITGIVFSFLDVTARWKAEEALRREARAQLSRARASNEFSGLLTALTLPDLVQLVASTRKTGTLTVLDGADRPLAAVGFLEGEIQAVSFGRQTGEAAFFALLESGGEAFRFEARPPASRDPDLGRTTMGLLLEGARRLDEAAGRGPDAGAGAGKVSP